MCPQNSGRQIIVVKFLLSGLLKLHISSTFATAGALYASVASGIVRARLAMRG